MVHPTLWNVKEELDAVEKGIAQLAKTPRLMIVDDRSFKSIAFQVFFLGVVFTGRFVKY